MRNLQLKNVLWSVGDGSLKNSVLLKRDTWRDLSNYPELSEDVARYDVELDTFRHRTDGYFADLQASLVAHPITLKEGLE